mgnify:FL=1
MESSVAMSFAELTATPDRFFSFLPDDWSVEIAPLWQGYAQTGSRIFALLENEKIVAGGIVFNTVSPDTQGYASIAQRYFDSGRLYIAFVFVSPAERGKGYGSLWVQKLRKHMPQQPFWLAIEDAALVKFYEPLGFTVIETVNNEGATEWVLVD